MNGSGDDGYVTLVTLVTVGFVDTFSFHYVSLERFSKNLENLQLID